jgi:hypothetical protein
MRNTAPQTRPDERLCVPMALDGSEAVPKGVRARQGLIHVPIPAPESKPAAGDRQRRGQRPWGPVDLRVFFQPTGLPRR